MNWKKLLLAVPLLALTYAPPAAEAKDHKWKRNSEKNYRYRSNGNNYGYYNYNRPGYTGQDRNRDGAISRYEWRGNNRSFERRDRNRDGRISPQDRYRYRNNNNRYDYNNNDRYWYYGR